ncbi:MAG: FAD-dependent oxidoreductase [Acidobacteria bacterium]|nr:FAD-dependent oxidoreductase [Acidobacteriota bacterium]
MKRDLGRLTAREHDLIVLGGGIVGAAAAWDAAQRGLDVALVEAVDFGAGTSWNSLKTIHGGLRHLQRADVGSQRESVRERRALLRIAPEIVRPLPFLVPAYGHGLKGREALACGVWLNDLLSADRNHGLPLERRIPPGRVLSRREVLDLVPGLPERGMTGGVVWTDAQVTHGERLVMGFVHAADEKGAAVANAVEATGLLRSGSRVTGIRAKDARTGEAFDVCARVVLNTAGPAVSGVLALAGITRPPVPLLRAMNLVLSRPAVTTHAVGASSGRRYLFLVPWRGRVLAGTAYEPGEIPEAAGETDAFFDEAARAFPWAGLRREDVALVHRGRVPGRGDAAGLWSRARLLDHETEDGVPGLLSVVTVKYTTARGLAAKAVDRVVARLGKTVAPCRTATTVLPAARPLVGSLEEQARQAVRDEMALTLADVVLRRMDLGTAGRPAPADLQAVTGAVAQQLGWDAARLREEKDSLEAAWSGVAETPPAR